MALLTPSKVWLRLVNIFLTCGALAGNGEGIGEWIASVFIGDWEEDNLTGTSMVGSLDSKLVSNQYTKLAQVFWGTLIRLSHGPHPNQSALPKS